MKEIISYDLLLFDALFYFGKIVFVFVYILFLKL